MYLAPDVANAILREGEVVDLRGVSSFSTSKKEAVEFSESANGRDVRMVFEVVAKKGVTLGAVSAFPEEEETLLGGKLKLGKPVKKGGVFYVKAEHLTEELGA
jgi:hypothetical protein